MLPSTGQLHDAFVNAINGAPNKISRERICFNCFGWGHERKDCPSECRARDLKAFLVLITAICAKGGSRRIPIPAVGGDTGGNDGTSLCSRHGSYRSIG